MDALRTFAILCNVWYDFPLLLVVGVCLLELFSRIHAVPGETVVTVLFCLATLFSYVVSLLVGHIPRVGPYLLYLKPRLRIDRG